jgi:2-oxoglutarate ferredoxin oxidoreductase subunit alpha
MYWLYSRPLDTDDRVARRRSSRKKPELAEANIKALPPATTPATSTSSSRAATKSRRAPRCPMGTYRNIMGNEAVAIGLVAGAQLANLQVFLGSYPITPAPRASSSARGLQALRRRSLPGGGRDRGDLLGDGFGSYAGCLGITTTSGRAWR